MSRLNIAILVLVLMAIGSFFLPVQEPLAQAQGAYQHVRIGLVFDVGGRGDKSFNDAAYEGLSRAASELGTIIEMLEPSSSEDREAAMRLFAARGFDLIIGVGFIFSTDIQVVAKAFPNSKFACIDFIPPSDGNIPPNVVGLTFREEEGSFLVGAVAGLLTQSHKVGFVGGMDIPLIHKFQAGYEAGVHATCPTCSIFVGYAGTTPDAFRDPVKGKSIAISQISSGSDILFHASGTTGHGVFEAAKDMRVFAIGVDADQYDEMPNVVITSMIKRGDVAVYETIRSVCENRFQNGVKSFGLSENGVTYVHDGPHAAKIPQSVKNTVFDLQQKIIRGEMVVPKQ